MRENVASPYEPITPITEGPMTPNANTFTQKIHSLNPDQLAEVSNLVEFLSHRNQEHALTKSVLAISSPAFEAVWSNPEDAACDEL